MERKIKSELVKASDSIKRKYRQLRSGLEEESFLAKKRFEPLIKPLETLIDLTDKNQKVLADAVKKEEPKDEPMEHPLNESMELPEQDEMEVSHEEDPREVSEELLAGVRRKRQRKNKHQRERAAAAKSLSEDNRNTADETESPPYHENVFETSTDEEKKTWEEWERYLSRFGPLTREYLNGMVSDTKDRYDMKFGPRCDNDRMLFRMGNTPIHFDNEDYVHIGSEEGEYAQGAMYHGTRGLYELIFKKEPIKKLYNEQDLRVYKDILELTNAHMQKYNPDLRLASSSSRKYNEIISPLFRGKKGGALLPVTNSQIEYIHWDDPNELVGRLALLIASREAGNNGHEAEIASIEEELREGNYIQ